MKILPQTGLWTRTSLLNFGAHPDRHSGSRVRTPDPDSGHKSHSCVCFNCLIDFHCVLANTKLCFTTTVYLDVDFG